MTKHVESGLFVIRPAVALVLTFWTMKFLRSYKEILFGLGLGMLAWVIDAVMHVQLGADVHAEGLWKEIFDPNSTTLIFRVFYLSIAVAFGIFLWRANWSERQIRTIERSLITFQRQLDGPALRLLGLAGQLRGRNSVRLDETAQELVDGIVSDAGLIDELAKRYLEFSRLVQEGETTQAIETLNSIESWLAERKFVAKS